MIIIEAILLTVKDIQESFQISKNTAYKLINTKGFPKIKIGNQIRIPKSDLDLWISKYTGKEFMI